MHRAKHTESVLDSEVHTSNHQVWRHHRYQRVLEQGFHAPVHDRKAKHQLDTYHGKQMNEREHTKDFLGAKV